MLPVSYDIMSVPVAARLPPVNSSLWDWPVLAGMSRLVVVVSDIHFVLLVPVNPILNRTLLSLPPRFDAATLREVAIELVAETNAFDVNSDDASGQS